MAGDNSLEEFLKTVDKSKFTNAPYAKRVEKPWGYEIHWAPENLPYMGKIIHITAGKRLSLQIHDKKQETQMLISGQCNLIQDDPSGNLITIKMEQNKGYTAAIGQRHRLHAVSDCDIIEVSTPEIGNTYRLEDDYARGTETEEIRKDPNRGWK